MGRLALVSRKIFFEYDSSFLDLALQLSAFKLPLKLGQKAQSIIDQVRDVVSKWEQFAKEADVTKQSSKNIQAQLSTIK